MTAHDIADELRRRDPGIGKKKLHKLLYYVQGAHLARTGDVAFEEQIVAWKMGPVVSSLWADEKYDRQRPAPSHLDAEVMATVDEVVSRYGCLTGNQLEALTHQEDPWVDAFERRNVPGHSTTDIIEVEAIAKWFGRVAEHRRRTDPRLRHSMSASVHDAVLQALSEDPVVGQHRA